MVSDEPEQALDQLVEERQGHGRAAWPSTLLLVKYRMAVFGPFTKTAAVRASRPIRTTSPSAASIARGGGLPEARRRGPPRGLGLARGPRSGHSAPVRRRNRSSRLTCRDRRDALGRCARDLELADGNDPDVPGLETSAVAVSSGLGVRAHGPCTLAASSSSLAWATRHPRSIITTASTVSVFLAPFGPSNPTISPPSIVKLRSSTPVWSPNRLVRLVSSITATRWAFDRWSFP